ncbi:MAG: hypothetical protein M4579_001177 [Chaenotheca gracillima]|nr:MAG: hypothetical protein M4579_001177 [Chaenotheca gracillima]
MAISKTLPMKVADGKTVQVPSVGFGTWAADWLYRSDVDADGLMMVIGGTGWCKEATLAALKAGYRHLDCAWKYGVDEEVGAAIRESGVPRSEIFITSKFWPHFAHPDNVETCLDLVLKNTGIEYIDLFLAHWPVAFKPLPNIGSAQASPEATNEENRVATDGSTGKEALDLEHCAANIAAEKGAKGSFVPTWKAMQTLVRKGKCRAVGVSNFSITQLKEILPHASDVPISCNQVEAHPWFPNDELVSFMISQSILPTVYSPFAGQKEDGRTLISDPVVKRISEKNGMGVGQCLQSWAVMRGTIPLGKSQNPDRIKANLSIGQLPKEDFDAISALKLPGDSGRTIDFSEAWNAKLFT